MPDDLQPDHIPVSGSTTKERKPPLLTIPRLATLIAAAILLGGLVFFVADNFVLVQIRVFTLRIQARLAWALFVPLMGGLALGWLAHGIWLRVQQRRRS